MQLNRASYENIFSGAARILRENDTGSSTKPAPRLYPHQWNWDSAFIAIGLSHIDDKRAQLEIASLLDGQWANGMVPHIIFNPESTGYSPGPDYWRTHQCPDAPKGTLTSGITQPPILAFAAYRVFKNAKDRNGALDFLRSIYKKLIHYHEYLYDVRDFKKEGLACIIHPWESGMDNTPSWDDLLKRIKIERKPEYERIDKVLISENQRPTDKDYDAYSYLVELFRSLMYDMEAIKNKSPFLVQSVVFNSLLLASLKALKSIGTEIHEDTGRLDDWTALTENAIQTKLWNEEAHQYFDYDVLHQESIRRNILSNYLPLFAGSVVREKAERMIHLLLSQDTFWPQNGYPLCTVSMKESEFNPQNYWRGPVWINMNWMFIEGLAQYGYHNAAEDLARKTLDLVTNSGFYEYYNPLNGEGLGSDRFSWSASLVIDLIETHLSGRS